MLETKFLMLGRDRFIRALMKLQVALGLNCMPFWPYGFSVAEGPSLPQGSSASVAAAVRSPQNFLGAYYRKYVLPTLPAYPLLCGISISHPCQASPFSFKWHGWVGLVVIAAAEILLFYGVPFVRTFFTPLVWSGYILFIDAVVYRRKGTSLIVTRRREFFPLLFLSVVFWLVFEFYNLYLRNWHYVGLPEDLPWRLFGYVWAFATIWPAILETAEALEEWKGISRRRIHPWKITPGLLSLSLGFGAFCLVLPLITSPDVAHYLAAPVWLGFIFPARPLELLDGQEFPLSGPGERRPAEAVQPASFRGGVRFPLGVLELLGRGQVALHRSHTGRDQDLRDAGPGLPGVPSFRR